MKKIFFAIVLSAGMTVAFAQTKTSTSSYNVNEMSQQMQADLQLDEAQYIRVKSINRDRANRMAEIDRMYANDPAMRQQKTDALNSEFDSRYQEVMRGEQYNRYLSSQGRATQPAGSEINTDQAVPASGSQDVMEGTLAPGDEMKIKTEDAKLKVEQGDELKFKNDATDTKIKAEDDRMKVESPDYKMKSEQGDKMKVETPNAEMKVKSDKEKVKTDNAKYKFEDDKTKIQNSDDNSKVKIQGDKLKVEDKSGKLKVEDDKMKVKSRD